LQSSGKILYTDSKPDRQFRPGQEVDIWLAEERVGKPSQWATFYALLAERHLEK